MLNWMVCFAKFVNLSMDGRSLLCMCMYMYKFAFHKIVIYNIYLD